MYVLSLFLSLFLFKSHLLHWVIISCEQCNVVSCSSYATTALVSYMIWWLILLYITYMIHHRSFHIFAVAWYDKVEQNSLFIYSWLELHSGRAGGLFYVPGSILSWHYSLYRVSYRHVFLISVCISSGFWKKKLFQIVRATPFWQTGIPFRVYSFPCTQLSQEYYAVLTRIKQLLKMNV